jgi:hypothetical protein
MTGTISVFSFASLILASVMVGVNVKADRRGWLAVWLVFVAFNLLTVRWS